jgi:transcriptional regulator with XRE-family HTH domain
MTGKELRVNRNLMDLNQGQLADKLGVSRVTISNWERIGDVQIPRNSVALIMSVFPHFKEKVTSDTFSSVSLDTLALFAKKVGDKLGLEITVTIRAKTVKTRV